MLRLIMKLRSLIAFLVIAGVCGALYYYFSRPIPDNRVQHNFVEAARRGEISAVQKLHSAGASLDAPPSYENGALHGVEPIYAAIGNERVDAVRWLLERGADPNLRIGPDTPLDVADYLLAKRPSSEALREIVALLK